MFLLTLDKQIFLQPKIIGDFSNDCIEIEIDKMFMNHGHERDDIKITWTLLESNDYDDALHPLRVVNGHIFEIKGTFTLTEH